MSCRRVQSRLSAYLDGELPPAERVRVSDHLAGCARCAAEAASLRRTVRLMRTTGGFVPPPDLRARLDLSVLSVAGTERETRPWRLRPVLPPAVGMAAVAVALLFSISLPRAPRPPRVSRTETLAPGSVVRATPPQPVAVDAPPSAPAAPTPRIARASTAPTPAPRPAAAARKSSARQPAATATPARSDSTARKARQRMPQPAAPALAPPALPAPTPAPVSEPMVMAEILRSCGRHAEAVDVLNAALAQAQLPAETRERNALVDSAIAECSTALRHDPGNANALKFLDEAYSTKLALLRSVAG